MMFISPAVYTAAAFTKCMSAFTVQTIDLKLKSNLYFLNHAKQDMLILCDVRFTLPAALLLQGVTTANEHPAHVKNA